MKRIIIFFLLILSSHIASFPQAFAKGTFTVGVDALFGQFGSNDKLGGGIIHGGYEFFFRQVSFLSLEPKIGLGYLGNRKTEVLSDAFISDYNVACLTASISPRLRWSLNPDNNAFVFIDNEFALLNGYATVRDPNTTLSRKSSGTFQFYYALKLGIILKTSEKCKFAIWVGGSTLKLDPIVNNNIPLKQERYSNEGLPYMPGITFYL